MRFFELDGKRYEVEHCYNCQFVNDEWQICAHPSRDNNKMFSPTTGVHELCPLREVEHNQPQPPRMHLMFDQEARKSYIDLFARVAKSHGHVTIPAAGPRADMKADSQRMADYFGVTVDAIHEPDPTHTWFWQIIFSVPKDWSPEKVGSPDLIPFATQQDLSVTARSDSE